MWQCLKLFSLLLLVSSYSKAECLPDVTGICTPGVTITEEEDIVITEESTGTEIITTTTTTEIFRFRMNPPQLDGHFQ